MIYFSNLTGTIKYYLLNWHNNKVANAYSNVDVEMPELKREDATAELCILTV